VSKYYRRTEVLNRNPIRHDKLSQGGEDWLALARIRNEIEQILCLGEYRAEALNFSLSCQRCSKG
jgi:hypothetical protein